MIPLSLFIIVLLALIGLFALIVYSMVKQEKAWKNRLYYYNHDTYEVLSSHTLLTGDLKVATRSFAEIYLIRRFNKESRKYERVWISKEEFYKMTKIY